MTLSRVLRDLIKEGYQIDVESVAALSPYMTRHIDRFGQYTLDLARQPPVLDYDSPVVTIAA